MPQIFMRFSSDQYKKNDPGHLFHSAVEKEFYTADTCIEGNPQFCNFEMAKAELGQLRIFRVSYRGLTKCTVNRTWDDIRKDNKQFYLMWFPNIGETTIEQTQKCNVIDKNSLGLNHANKPFKIKVQPDINGGYETYLVALPVHLVKSFIPHFEQLSGRAFFLGNDGLNIVRSTFINLFNEGDKHSEKVANAYVNAALQTISESLTLECENLTKETDIKHVRIKSILKYIEYNLSNHELSASHVASECEISSRYLHLLFNELGISFHRYVTSKRLEIAKHWLCSTNSRQISISEAAYTSGFKSLSSFSRAFKCEFGISPKFAKDAALKGFNTSSRQ